MEDRDWMLVVVVCVVWYAYRRRTTAQGVTASGAATSNPVVQSVAASAVAANSLAASWANWDTPLPALGSVVNGILVTRGSGIPTSAPVRADSERQGGY